MSQREPDFAFPLDHIPHIFLDRVFVGLAANNSLNLKHAWAVRILHCALDEMPHLLTLFSHMIMLPLCLCIDETVSQVYLPESFSLFPEFCFSNLTVMKTVM